jgi:hypothetical protein
MLFLIKGEIMKKKIKIDSYYYSFYELLIELDRSMLNLWDFEEYSYKVENVEEYFKVCSSGQEVVLSFLIMVWRGYNEFNFDLCKAAKYLNQCQLNIISKWISDPRFY